MASGHKFLLKFYKIILKIQNAQTHVTLIFQHKKNSPEKTSQEYQNKINLQSSAKQLPMHNAPATINFFSYIYDESIHNTDDDTEK